MMSSMVFLISKTIEEEKKRREKSSFRILRLDYDQNGKIRQRSTKSSTFLSLINDEINKLPSDLFSIERLNSSRTIKTTSNGRDEQLGLTFRCKLISHSNPIVPALVIHLSSSYPDQPPVILSLTKCPTPKLDFAEGNSLLEKISNIFVGKLFQLAREHTFTDILDIWVKIETKIQMKKCFFFSFSFSVNRFKRRFENIFFLFCHSDDRSSINMTKFCDFFLQRISGLLAFLLHFLFLNTKNIEIEIKQKQETQRIIQT